MLDRQTAVNPNDLTPDRIRRHLKEIAAAFAAGDFAQPRAIHDRMPPGAADTAELRRDIIYSL